jgi:spore germination cell wall hydrolase CwlJ-like protein
VSRIQTLSNLFARAAALVAIAALAACSGGSHSAQEHAKLTSARLSVMPIKTLPAMPSAGDPLNALPPAQAMQATGADAEALNAARPFDHVDIEPMRPFVLKTDAADQARAVHCLAQAVYYEAAREPLKGQQAVAQVVLNRVRHPAYPKSVCGVVYQGAQLPTGCQFSFTCDGSLRRTPEALYWDRAVTVAKQALSGFVDKEVGSATHYHADYVAPYWAPTLVKMAKVGQQIFYRWGGASGEPDAFTGRYAGHEAVLTKAILQSTPRVQQADAATPVEHKVTLVQGVEARVYKVANPGETTGDADADSGTLHASRRQPTRDEVQAINARLAEMESKMSSAPSVPDAASAATAASAQVPAGG